MGDKRNFEKIVSSIGDAIAIKDLDFRVIYENEAHVRLKGRHVGEFCYRAYHNKEDICEGCPVALTYKDGQIHYVRRTLEMGKNKRWLEITASPLRDSSGEIIAGIEVIRDVTEKKKIEESLTGSNKLLSSMSMVYSTFFETGDYHLTFDALLAALLDLSGSEYGFLAEVLYTAQGLPYLKTHAITDISWDADTRALYRQHPETGFESLNLETLFGEVLVTGQPVLSNSPSKDAGGGGLPDGHPHPPLNCFLGIPFHKGGSVIGMVGIANRPGGYDEDIISYLDTYLKTCTNMMDSFRNENKRRKAETDLQRSENHFKEIFENSPISMWEEDFTEIMRYFESLKRGGVTDFRSYFADNPMEVLHCASLVRIVNVNRTTRELYGASDKNELMRSLHMVFTDASLRAFTEGLIALSEGRTSFESEAVNRTLQGRELKLHMKWSILPGYESDWSKVMVTMNDLTALRQAEEYVRNILETVDEGFLVIDRDFNIVSSNRAYSDKSGTSEAALRGRKCFEVSHRKSHPCFEEGEDCPVAKTFMTGNATSATHIHEDASGNKYYAELKSYPIKDSSGRVVSAIETIVDISERVKLQEELVKSQKLESVGILAGGIAHDFNNLLMGISGHISLAKLTADAAARINIDEAERALRQARRLTQQLLTFSRGGEPVKKTLDLSLVLQNAIKFALSGSNVSSETSLGKDLKAVDADEGQITQVIHNIVINAMEAMPHGGTLTVSGSNVDIGLNSGIPLEAGGYVRVCLKDEGVGIPKEYLSRIFDPYFTTKKRGSGLGLTTSYSIIKRHGGHIEVESRPGGGTEFIIYLPASERALDADHSPVRGLVKGGGKILVMDDEETVRIVCHNMLRTAGYDAEFAEEGGEAIAKYSAARESGRPFDVVVLDLTIRGGMGGRETIRRLLEIDPDVRAVVSSGYSEDPIVANHKSYGFKSVLCKPYQIEEMTRVLHEVLREAR